MPEMLYQLGRIFRIRLFLHHAGELGHGVVVAVDRAEPGWGGDFGIDIEKRGQFAVVPRIDVFAVVLHRGDHGGADGQRRAFAGVENPVAEFPDLKVKAAVTGNHHGFAVIFHLRCGNRQTPDAFDEIFVECVVIIQPERGEPVFGTVPQRIVTGPHGAVLGHVGFLDNLGTRQIRNQGFKAGSVVFWKGSVYKSYAFMACSFSNQRDRPTMDHKQFQDWLSGIDHLSPAQRQEAETVFMGVSEASSSLAAIEASVGESRQCPHCGTPGAISRGKARGLRRYQCKGCNKTFNAATGTPLSGLHRKDKWLAFGTCLSDGLTVRASAERCKFAVNTAFRWRHRFLTTDNPKARKLTGIVEVDETYVLQSQKGERNLERKARRRGGKARKRGLSDEQVPVLVAADRSGMTVSAVLPAVNADTLQSAIGAGRG